MFSIANSIAYDGQMVQATPGALAAPPIPAGPSGWFDIRGTQSLDGHAIAEEVQTVAGILQLLSRYPNPIFIISPFRSVADLCRQRFETPLVKCGTIHTFQGKEADIVILVLGTLPNSTAARNWAAAGPNILNVAVTRARHRLYVIGDRRAWSMHQNFNTLAAQLPANSSGLLL